VDYYRPNNPRHKIPSFTENLCRGNQGCKGRRNQRADAGARHQPPRQIILLGTVRDLSVKFGDLRFQMAPLQDQSLSGCDYFNRRPTARTLNDLD